jgi:hypothetical protein
MTGYNKINGEYAGGNGHLLNDVLKVPGIQGLGDVRLGRNPELRPCPERSRPGIRRVDGRDDVGNRVVRGTA